MSKRAVIVGWHHIPFGKLDDPDTESLMARVAAPALAHAGLDAQAVDGIYVGVMNSGFQKQDFQGALVATSVPGLEHVPACRLENACATGSAALYAAMDFIEAGRGRVALVVGAEKMTARPTSEVGDILLNASYRKEEAGVAGGFAGLFAQIAQAYFARHSDQSAALARIAAKNHRNGVDNPYAQLRRDLGFDFCNTVSEKNPYVAAPLRRTDCSLVSDGAAALVLADEDTAASLARAIAFRARAHVNDALPLSRRDPTAFEGARRAGARRWPRAAWSWTTSAWSRPTIASPSPSCWSTRPWAWRRAGREARCCWKDGPKNRPPAGQSLGRPEGQGPSGGRHRGVHACHGLHAAHGRGRRDADPRRHAGGGLQHGRSGRGQLRQPAGAP